MLIALMAPRPLLLQTGDSDLWADPKGEFLAAKAAGPVYQLLGQSVPEAEEFPPAGIPCSPGWGIPCMPATMGPFLRTIRYLSVT